MGGKAMPKTMKKWFTTSLIVPLAVMVASGCTNNSSNTSSNESANQGKTTSMWSVPVEDGKYTEPVSISQLKITPADVKYAPGEDENDNHFTKWLSKQFNIEISYPWTAAQQDTFNSKLSLMLASGEEMPDIVMANGDIVNDLIDSGKFMEVGSMFDKYANDEWKTAMEQVPNAWLPNSRDGERYAIPVLSDAYTQDEVLWVRQDWLDKLGLKAPTTLAEMEEVMDAFVNQDPDGNGKKDTIGLSIGIKDGFVSYMSDTAPLFGANGTIPAQWNLTSDGALEYGSIHPGAKKTLETLARWYEKGYLPKEAAVYDINKAAEPVVQGKAGMIFGAHWLAEWPLSDVVKNDPAANFQPIPIPAGADGDKGFRVATPLTGSILINKDSKHPDAFFLYQNWLYEHYPERKAPFDVPYEVGQYFDLNEGVAKEGTFANADKLSMTLNFATMPNLRMELYADLNAGKEVTNSFMDALSRKPEGNRKAAQILLDSKEYGIPNMFQGSPTKTMKAKKAFLDKMELETFTQIIYGQAPISDFDKFVEKWESSGGKEITKEVNNWYKSASGK
jgi:putative aldouronate transport system substrate-binding protein